MPYIVSSSWTGLNIPREASPLAAVRFTTCGHRHVVGFFLKSLGGKGVGHCKGWFSVGAVVNHLQQNLTSREMCLAGNWSKKNSHIRCDSRQIVKDCALAGLRSSLKKNKVSKV